MSEDVLSPSILFILSKISLSDTSNPLAMKSSQLITLSLLIALISSPISTTVSSDSILSKIDCNLTIGILSSSSLSFGL